MSLGEAGTRALMEARAEHLQPAHSLEQTKGYAASTTILVAA